MNRVSQIARLILDFYREEPEQLKMLEPLRTCKVFRRWGVLYIRSQTHANTIALTRASELIAEPVAKLRLAQKMTFLTKNTSIAVVPVDSDKINA